MEQLNQKLANAPNGNDVQLIRQRLDAIEASNTDTGVALANIETLKAISNRLEAMEASSKETKVALDHVEQLQAMNGRVEAIESRLKTLVAAVQAIAKAQEVLPKKHYVDFVMRPPYIMIDMAVYTTMFFF